MSKKSFLKFLFFLFLVLSFLSFGQFVLACEEGETQDCDPCGVQTCDDCREIEVPIIPPMVVTVCDWGNCDPDGQTQDCGTCGVQECQCEGKSCSWEEDCDETRKPSTKKTKNWIEYRCQEESCGNQYIEKRKAYQDYARTVSCLGGGKWKRGTWKKDGSPYYDATSTIEQCDLDWQLCSGSTNWSRASRSCNCAGTCLETPKNPRYYNNPNYPTNPYEPEESENANNIFLPVKLDWDNVKAWKNDWEENGELKQCSEDCFQSYLIEISNTASGNFSKALTQDSEYNPTQDQGACFLKPGITHNWDVSACCNANGTNCSPKSNWSFISSSAPEPILPADPDWTHPESAQNIPLPVSLKWCKVETIENKEILSYILTPYLIENENIICHPARQGEKECLPILVINPILGASRVEYIDENMSLFTKLTSYAWQIAACEGSLGGECGQSSQIWKFETGEIILTDVVLLSPANNEVVGFPVTLRWMAPPGANSFQYELYKDLVKVASGLPNPPSESSILFENLELNTEYQWRVMPCKDFEGKDCENWSEKWSFKTTGATPQPTYPLSKTINVPIPIKLTWENVAGAKSYEYWLYSEGILINNNVIKASANPETIIQYDFDIKQPKQETNYSWQVATCADEQGNFCGAPTSLQSFRTFTLSAPLNLSPKDNEIVFTYQMPKALSWESDVKYFRFTLDYVQKAEQEIGDCPLRREEKITNSSSHLVSLSCLGEYQWQVQACLDENCNEQGEPSIQSFILDQTIPPAQFGLVPCGRSSDNPNTPWNERDSCQFKHLFILFRNILDFLLWRVTLIILLLLIIATAMIFYFSIGSPAMIIDIRGVWKTAGKGYAIIFLSWIIINLVLNILGYQVGIFGQWSQIKF